MFCYFFGFLLLLFLFAYLGGGKSGTATLGLLVHAAGISFSSLFGLFCIIDNKYCVITIITFACFYSYCLYYHILTFFLLILADGVALGAAATTPRTDVEMIVFFAIMLHKVYFSAFLKIFFYYIKYIMILYT